MTDSFSFYDSNDVAINGDNPIAFGFTEVGSVSDVFSLWIWNDRGGILGAADISVLTIFGLKVNSDSDNLFNGTPFNKNISMLEARSTNAFNTTGDWMKDWTPISPIRYLLAGRMPANSARLIELRINVPYDAVLFDEAIFTLRVSGQ